MPTYEYKCSACNHTFERFQSITADPIKKCPQCGKSKVKRLLGTGAGLIFKGSGFYITDYRSDAYQKAAKGDTPGGGGETKSDGGSSGESKTDKPEAKPAAGSGAAESKPAAAASKSESAPKSGPKKKK
jgi:putative FmdB family regulatory protein